MGLFGGGNQDASVHISAITDSQNFNEATTTALNNVGNIVLGGNPNQDTPTVATIKALVPVFIAGAAILGAIALLKDRR